MKRRCPRIAATRLPADRAAGQAADGGEQLVWLDRLRQVHLVSHPHGPGAVLGAREGGEGNGRRPATALRRTTEKRDSARLFRSMKLCSRPPEGSSLTARRPSVKSICSLCAPSTRQLRTSVSCSRSRSSMKRSRG